ncbi:MAG: hypothetical protein M1826_005486 [Phylliscum demangeonii]|nr:MAG: hypothetical protein M1826_005486 [Phylliscum demangeonii]
MADSEISLMWEEAVSQYNETAGVNLLDADFPKPESADDLLSLVDKRESNFSKFKSKRGKIFAVLKVALKPVQLLGKLAADGASTAFRPSSAIFGAVNYLIEVAKGVSAHYDTIIKLFAAVKEFTCRLRVHQQQKIDPELQRIVTEILITLMSICAISTKSIKRGRFLKYTKAVLLGPDPAVQDALDRLKSLTENENDMVVALISAQTGKTGKVVDNVDLNVVDTKATVKDMHEQISSSADKGPHLLTLFKEQRRQIIRWLKAPDPNTRHYAECKRHQRDTGLWLIDDNEAYRSWKLEPASFLWLHGGAYAYFYFDFNSPETQRHDILLRSLALQLLERCAVTPRELEKLYSSHQLGEQPPAVHDLTTILRSLVERFPQTYIIVDALDECDDWDGLLDVIKDIVGLKMSSLHLLVTSRKEKKIEECFHALQPVLIPLQRSQIDGDIRLYVHQCLLTTAELKIWPAPVQHEMEEALVNGAKGM